MGGRKGRQGAGSRPSRHPGKWSCRSGPGGGRAGGGSRMWGPRAPEPACEAQLLTSTRPALSSQGYPATQADRGHRRPAPTAQVAPASSWTPPGPTCWGLLPPALPPPLVPAGRGCRGQGPRLAKPQQDEQPGAGPRAEGSHTCSVVCGPGERLSGQGAFLWVCCGSPVPRPGFTGTS